MKALVLVPFFLFLLSPTANSQGEGAIPFLNLNPDPHSLAMGWGGPANVSAGPFGYYYNPALLGYYAQKTNAAFQTYTTVPNWLRFGLRVNQNAFTLGYSFKNVVKNLNINTGFGYSHSRMDFGTFYITGPNSPDPIGTSHPYDKYDAYSFGVMLDYYIGFSFGMSFKKTVSELSSLPTAIGEAASVSLTAKDWGVLISVPVIKLLFNDPVLTTEFTTFKPYLNFALGYSKSNLGDDIYYIDPAQKEPIDRVARLGYNISLGTYINLFDTPIKLVDVNLMITSEDKLIKLQITKNPDGSENYHGVKDEGFGKFNIIQNLILWKPSNNLLIRKGSSFSFFETVTIMGGAFAGIGYEWGPPSTEGYAISSEGLFKLISVAAENNSLMKYFFDHFEFRYVNATTFARDEFSTTLTSATVSLKNISL